MLESVRDPYFKYFCGEAELQWRFPCDPCDLVHFRKRIGKEGVEKLLALSVRLQGKDVKRSDVIIETTVKGKNITFPTNAKLYRKIVDKCNKIAKQEGVILRQSYKRSIKELM